MTAAGLAGVSVHSSRSPGPAGRCHGTHTSHNVRQANTADTSMHEAWPWHTVAGRERGLSGRKGGGCRDRDGLGAVIPGTPTQVGQWSPWLRHWRH